MLPETEVKKKGDGKNFYVRKDQLVSDAPNTTAAQAITMILKLHPEIPSAATALRYALNKFVEGPEGKEYFKKLAESAKAEAKPDTKAPEAKAETKAEVKPPAKK